MAWGVFFYQCLCVTMLVAPGFLGQSQSKCFHSFTVCGIGASPFENIHQNFFQENMGLWLIALLRNNYWMSVSCRRDKFEEDTYFPINCKAHSLPLFDLRERILVFSFNFQIVYLFRTYQWILRPYLVSIFCFDLFRNFFQQENWRAKRKNLKKVVLYFFCKKGTELYYETYRC